MYTNVHVYDEINTIQICKNYTIKIVLETPKHSTMQIRIIQKQYIYNI